MQEPGQHTEPAGSRGVGRSPRRSRVPIPHLAPLHLSLACKVAFQNQTRFPAQNLGNHFLNMTLLIILEQLS